ncbi:MAG: hypothetical protein FJ004_03510 [Chloroflexi bacterium]|nr:hypothetical protein [Chloroflexota bacterium]
MLRRMCLLFVISALLVSMLAGCTSKSTTEAIGLVPEGANMLAQIDFNEIITDEEITELYDKAFKDQDTPRTFEEVLDGLKDEYGIDLMKFNTITFFGDTSELEVEDGTINLAIIVEGTFDKGDLLVAIEDAAAEADVELDSYDYKGYDVYAFEDEEGAFVFLRDGMFAFGLQVWIEDVIDVAKGDRKALRGVVLDTFNDLDEALIRIAAGTVSPGQADDQLSDEISDFLGDLSTFENMETVGMTLGREKASLSLDMKLYAADGDSAEAMEQALRGMIVFVQLAASLSEGSEIPEWLLSILGNLDISRSGSCVTINLRMSFSEIESLVAEGSSQI